MGNYNIFGPGRLEVSSPSLVIHEEGHFLHKKNLKYNQGLYGLFNKIRGFFRPFLNKKEKSILIEDFKRAYSEGYFNDLNLDKCLAKGYINEKTLKALYEKPEALISRNAMSCPEEFIADYFSLAAQGFKFSPEVTKRYRAFHGPEIKDIITRKETEDLINFRKNLEKRVSINLDA